MIKKFSSMGLVAVLCLIGIAQTVEGAVLRVHTNADIRSTDPGVNRDANTDGVVLHMVEGLVGYDSNGEPQPLLAKSIAISEDGLQYTFRLREDVKFHNGAPLTAEDVKWSWDRFMNPATGWRCISDFDGRVRLKVEKVEVLDAHNVRFHLNYPTPLFLSSLARNDCGMTAITHRDSVRADGSWDKPIGTGPFKLNEWRQREYISLVRNEDYANPNGDSNGYVGSKRPLVDEIRFIVIPDAATAKTAFLSGAVDMVTRLPYAEAVEFGKQPDATVYASSILAPNALLLQTRDPLLGNIAMRRAIASAINYQELAHGASYGLAEPNNSIVPLSSRYHSAVQKRGFEFDPAQTKRLLAQAGYKGEKLIITTNKQYTHHFDIAVIAQAMLQSAGINTELEVVEWGTQLERWQTGNYQLMAFGYSARMDTALSFESIMGPKDKQARKVWEDPTSLALLDEAMREGEPAKRQAIFDQLHRNAIDQVPLIVVFNTLTNDVVRKGVSGYRPSVFGTVRAWEVEKK